MEHEQAADNQHSRNVMDYAIIIGIQHYETLNPLSAPVKDAKAFRDWVLDPEGGNLPKENCFFISNTKRKPFQPTREKIDQALDSIIRAGQVRGYRRLYFYFSGHGIGASWKEIGMCLPNWSESYLNAAISSTTYLNYFVTSDLFEEILFFMDCCRTRKVNFTPMGPSLGWVNQGGREAIRSMSMYAAAYEAPAREGISVGKAGLEATGYFSKALIEGLRGAAVDPVSGNITMFSLHSHVRNRTMDLSRENNQIQEARLSVHETDGDFVIKKMGTATIDLTIQFSAKRNAVLKSPIGLQVLKKGSVKAGDSWSLGVPPGVYTVEDDPGGGQPKVRQFISVEVTPSELTYVF